MENPNKQKSSRKASEKQGSEKHGRYTESRGSHEVTYPTSFLFTVIELVCDYESYRGQARDQWWNLIPPTNSSGYIAEIPSPVMRYENGDVTLAEGYQWGRSEPEHDSSWGSGSIFMVDTEGNAIFNEHGQAMCLTQFSQFSVFSCNPHLPFVVTRGDPTVMHSATDMQPLLFCHPADRPGLSLAVTQESPLPTGPGIVKFIAGKDASWVPSLVPASYKNTEGRRPPSDGLAGELGIIIGLMAFNEPRIDDDEGYKNQTSRVFLGGDGSRGRWRGGKWHHTERPRGTVESMLEFPRGFLVTVFLDDIENEPQSTEFLLHHLQWNCRLVKESSSHGRS